MLQRLTNHPQYVIIGGIERKQTSLLENPYEETTMTTLETITTEMTSVVKLTTLINEVISEVDTKNQLTILYNMDEFVSECEMYVYGQYVLHSPLNQTIPISGRLLYRDENNISMVNDMFVGEITDMVNEFVEKRMYYVELEVKNMK